MHIQAFEHTYVVMLRLGMDDIPVFMSHHKPDAEYHAKRQRGVLSRKLQKIWNTDASEIVSVAIATFDKTGRIEAMEVVKTFDV